jgi:hypothetical protein
MHHHHDYHTPAYTYPHQPGLLGVFGGVINLTTAALYGGAHIVRTIVEGSVWHGEHPPHHGRCTCHGHACHVDCCPETHNCCGCC